MTPLSPKHNKGRKSSLFMVAQWRGLMTSPGWSGPAGWHHLAEWSRWMSVEASGDPLFRIRCVVLTFCQRHIKVLLYLLFYSRGFEFVKVIFLTVFYLKTSWVARDRWHHINSVCHHGNGWRGEWFRPDILNTLVGSALYQEVISLTGLHYGSLVIS